MAFITVRRLVSKATTDDERPAPGLTLAESVQFCRQDPSNVKLLIEAALNRLEQPSVQVRIKTLKFLQHLAQNGPPNVLVDLKLHSAQISACMGWRGAPHPTRGYEAYQDMKDLAQSVLDLAFAAQTSAPVPIAQPSPVMANPGPSMGPRVGGYGSMDSYGSGPVVTQRPSLEPRNLDPNAKRGVMDVVMDKLKIKKSPPPVSPYGTVTSNGGYTPPSQTSYASSGYVPTYDPQIQAATPLTQVQAPPQRSQFGRLEGNISWANRKPEFAPEQPKVEKKITPTQKLLKITGNRALPTKGELLAFKNAAVGENIIELEEALDSSDWRVKVRAIHGLEAMGEKYGLGAVAHTRSKLEPLMNAPQSSLRTAATRLSAALEGVEATGIPEEPSAFDFSNVDDDAARDLQGDGFDFGAEGQPEPAADE